jgi:hypothetical protein
VSIYLDTNAIPRSGDLETLEFSILVALARETGHELVVPALVVEEATSHRLRSIEGVFDVLGRAHRDAQRVANIPILPEFPVPGELAREFRRNLEDICRVVQMPEAGGDEALRRETYRLRPARGGAGARDVGIWLTVKAAHEAAGNDGFLLTSNTQDFANPEDRSQLHPDLRGEIERTELRLATSVAHLLELLEVPADAFIDEAFVAESEDCTRAVVRAVDDMNLVEVLRDVPNAPPPAEKRKAYLAGPVVAQLLAVNDARGFRVEGRRIGVCWTRWRLTLTVGLLERAGSGLAQTTLEVICEGPFQIWVRMDDEGAVSADVSKAGPLRPVD